MRGERVRLSRGLVVLPTEEGLVIDGGPNRQLLTGGAATSVLPLLLPLLDGERPLEAVADDIGITVAQVGQAIALLDQRGLIERYADTPPASATATYLSRGLAVTRAHRGVDQVLATLGGSSVLLAMPASVGDPLRADLLAAGVGQATGWSGDSDADRPAAVERAALVVAEDAGPAEFRDLARQCRAAATPLLRYAATPDGVEIGPLLHGGYTACYDCLTVPGGARQDAPARKVPAALTAGLLAAEVLAFVGRIAAVNSWRAVVRVAVPDLTTERVAVVPVPGCHECGMPAAGTDGAVAALRYEWLVEAPPAGVTPARVGEPLEGDPRDQALSKRHDDYPGSPRLALAAERDTDVMAALGTVLPRAVGHRPGKPASGAPSVDAYVVTAPRPLAGRAVGVFKYDDIRHELIATRSDAPPRSAALAGVEPAGPRPWALVVLVAAVGRLYGPHHLAAFRVAHLEAGAASVRLLAAAGEYGLTAVSARTWTGHLADLLELRPEHEVVAAVVALQIPEGTDAQGE